MAFRRPIGSAPHGQRHRVSNGATTRRGHLFSELCAAWVGRLRLIRVRFSQASAPAPIGPCGPPGCIPGRDNSARLELSDGPPDQPGHRSIVAELTLDPLRITVPRRRGRNRRRKPGEARHRSGRLVPCRSALHSNDPSVAYHESFTARGRALRRVFRKEKSPATTSAPARRDLDYYASARNRTGRTNCLLPVQASGSECWSNADGDRVRHVPRSTPLRPISCLTTCSTTTDRRTHSRRDPDRFRRGLTVRPLLPPKGPSEPVSRVLRRQPGQRPEPVHHDPGTVQIPCDVIHLELLLTSGRWPATVSTCAGNERASPVPGVCWHSCPRWVSRTSLG